MCCAPSFFELTARCALPVNLRAEVLNHQLVNANELLQRLTHTALPESQSRRIQA